MIIIVQIFLTCVMLIMAVLYSYNTRRLAGNNQISPLSHFLFRQWCSLSSAFRYFRLVILSRMFPRNLRGHDMKKRSSECFKVKRGLTNRLRNSAIPYMQRLLNAKEKRRREICRQIDDYQPVNNGLICKSVSLRD